MCLLNKLKFQEFLCIVPIPYITLLLDSPFSTYVIVIFSISKEPIAAKEQPNLGWSFLGFGSATIGHSITLAFAGLVTVIGRLYEAVALPDGSSPRAEGREI